MKVKITKNNYPFYIVSFLGLILISYTSFRAATLSFTHDESATFLWFVHHSYIQIISYHLASANNHMLNTLAIKLFTNVFPDIDFFIRLPNLLAHLAYIIFSVLILKRFKNKIILIFGFILINFNPYMLDFFSLARGYGLALAFVLASIYFLLEYIEQGKKKNIYLSLAMSSMAVLSHFVHIHFFIALILVFSIIHITDSLNPGKEYRGKIKKILKTNIPVLIISILLTIILFEPIRKLSKSNELYGHGSRSFYHNTLVSFINGIKYNQDYGPWFIKITAIVIIFFVFAVLIITAFYLIKNKTKLRNSHATIFITLLISPAISSILQHHLLGSQFITYRLTLFFFPILGFTIISFLNSCKRVNIRPYLSILLVIISLAFLYHTLKCANSKYVSEWKYDANTKNMIFELEETANNKLQDQKVKLGINWLFEPTINFYRTTRNLNWLEEVTREGIQGEYDYYYIFNEQLSALSNPEIIQEYKLSGTVFTQ